jgi:hypothetical protein
MAKRLGSKFWQEHLKAWKRSGLTQVAYCATHELSIKTFSRWRSRELAATTVAIKSPSLTLVPASVGASIQSSNVQLHSPGGWRIELPDGSVPWLSELLRQLP